jgi:transposase
VHTDWHPTGSDLSAAKAVLQGKLLAKALNGRRLAATRVRLAIVEALTVFPSASVAEVAFEAKTIPKTVNELLARWQRDGIDSFVQFGRPRDLDSAELEQLKLAIRELPLRSLTEVHVWIQKKVPLSMSSIRNYCRRLRVKLPLKFVLKEKAKRKKRRRQWTAKQVAELNGVHLESRNRITAVVRAGTEPHTALCQIAKDCQVPIRTLALDLKVFRQGRIRALARHFRRKNVLVRLGTWPLFAKWCVEQHQSTGKCPSAEDAKIFLKSLGISMPSRTVYTHLTRWRRDATIPLRRRRVREKLIPSEGFEVRAFRR